MSFVVADDHITAVWTENNPADAKTSEQKDSVMFAGEGLYDEHVILTLTCTQTHMQKMSQSNDIHTNDNLVSYDC